jgi:hypothetical protein
VKLFLSRAFIQEPSKNFTQLGDIALSIPGDPTAELPESHPASAEMDLDALFGEALHPERTDSLERLHPPRSLHRLDAETADMLRQLMEITERGFGATRYVYCELPILWIVDRDGILWFSVEEIIKEDTLEFVRPRLRNVQVEDRYQRLGHPALIKGDHGRIGGELLFDVGAPEPGWYLTNGSGRYGLREGRIAAHLSNAARKFGSYGITLREFFIPVKMRARENAN